jgi:hypothetical protein
MSAFAYLSHPSVSCCLSLASPLAIFLVTAMEMPLSKIKLIYFSETFYLFNNIKAISVMVFNVTVFNFGLCWLSVVNVS